MEATRKRLSGDRNQCPTCGLYFNSTRAFDKHRTGKYGKPLGDGTYIPSDRRCLSINEMQAKGMAENAKGFWITEPRAELPQKSI